MDEQQQPRVAWYEGAVYSSNGTTVRVNVLPLRVPQFSVTLSYETEGKNPSRFLRVNCRYNLGQVTVDPFDETVHGLMQQAFMFISEKAQEAADLHMASRIEREKSQLERGPKPVKGLSGGAGSGKTAKRREAKRLAKTAA